MGKIFQSFSDNLRQIEEPFRSSYGNDRNELFVAPDFSAFFRPREVSLQQSFKFSEVASLRELLVTNPDQADLIFSDLYQVYQESFSDPKEVISAERIFDKLSDPNLSWDILVAMRSNEVVGAVHFSLEEFKKATFAVEEHVYISSKYQNQGAGKALNEHFHQAMKDLKVDFILSEHCDPFIMSEDELAEDDRAFDRLKFWNKLGYETFDAPYIWPNEDGYFEYYRLGIFKLSETNLFSELADGRNAISKNDYMGLVFTYLTSNVDAKVLCDDRRVSILMQQIATIPDNFIRIIEANQERQYPQDRASMRAELEPLGLN